MGLFLGGAQMTAQDQAKPLPQATFEVASIKLADPKRTDTMFHQSPWGSTHLSITNASLLLLIEMAYGLNSNQVVDLPSWSDSAAYNIEAKAEDGTLLEYKTMQPMLQRLLEDRLGLKTHRTIKEFRGFALEIASGGPKLKPTNTPSTTGYIMYDELRSADISAGSLAAMMAHIVGVPVADKTGLEGKYDVDVKFAPQDGTGNQSLPSFFTAVQEQLGLKLQPQKVSVEMLVVDHVDRAPTEN